MAHRRTAISDDELFRLYFGEHWEVVRIAAHYGVNHTTISSRLQRSGRPIRPRTEPKHQIDRQILKDLYVTQKLSAPAVANKLGVSRLAVYNHLKKYELTRPAGGVLDDEHFDNLKPGRTVRISIDTSKGNFYSNIHKKARLRGYKVSVKKVGTNLVSIMRLPATQNRDSDNALTEIKKLYYRKKWKVRDIAKHLGLSREHAYRKMRAANLQLKERGKAKRIKTINKHKLTALYLNNRLSVPAIARGLGVEDRDVIYELDRHGIWPQARRVTRFDYPGIAKLQFWEEMEVAGDKREPSSRLIREAKWLNIRIVARRSTDGNYRLIRLPFLSRQAITSLTDDGIPLTHAARMLHADPKTLKLVLNSRDTGA